MSLPSLTPELARSWLETGAPGCRQISRAYCGVGVGMFLPEADEFLPANKLRLEFTKAIAYAIPCAEAVAVIATSGALLEVGAGTGYWAALLARAGVDVLATDNAGRATYGQKKGAFCPVVRLDAADAIRANPDRDIFLCWPSYDREWGARAIAEIASGRRLYLISEGEGGCCGSDTMFARLSADFDELQRVSIPQWWGVHDDLTVFVRR